MVAATFGGLPIESATLQLELDLASSLVVRMAQKDTEQSTCGSRTDEGITALS